MKLFVRVKRKIWIEDVNKVLRREFEPKREEAKGI
jgi:hypothetical protein